MLREFASEHLFLTFLQPWPRYGQNVPQKAYFEHFGSLGLDMPRMALFRKRDSPSLAGKPNAPINRHSDQSLSKRRSLVEGLGGMRVEVLWTSGS